MGTSLPSLLSVDSSEWCRLLASPLSALRLVFTVALERTKAASCMGYSSDTAICFWPSSLYTLLAVEATRSKQTWDVCSRAVEESLGSIAERYRSMSPAKLSRLFRDSAPLLNNREAAALLWALLRHREHASEQVAGRLGAEFETLMMQQAGSPGYSY